MGSLIQTGHLVYLSQRGSTNSPTLLFGDYQNGLCELMLKDTLYLSYFTTGQSLALWRCDSNSFGVFHTLESLPLEPLFPPFLFAHEKRPMLFYQNNTGPCFLQLDTLSHTTFDKEECLHLRKQLETAQAQLESARTQYAQLMQVANDYKTDAKKWHDKYITRS